MVILSQLVGFEPTLPEGNSFRVSRLNHSATTAEVNQRPLFKNGSQQLTLAYLLCMLHVNAQSIVGSVVECSPATRAARVRFPDDAATILPADPQSIGLDSAFLSIQHSTFDSSVGRAVDCSCAIARYP